MYPAQNCLWLYVGVLFFTAIDGVGQAFDWTISAASFYLTLCQVGDSAIVFKRKKPGIS